MEHKVEMLIRQKVHEADELVITWRKDWAWDHVELTPEKKPARWFYYAAASILFAGVTVASFVQWNQRQETLTKINALELKIAAVLAEHEKIATPQSTGVACDTPLQNTRPSRKHVAQRQETNQPVQEVPPVSPELQPTEVKIAKAEPVVQPMETPVAINEVSKPSIQAIIGIIPVQSDVITRTTSRKKFRMMLLNAPQLEAEYLSLGENKFITAKLK